MLKQLKNRSRLVSQVSLICALGITGLNAQNATKEMQEPMEKKAAQEQSTEEVWVDLFNGEDLTGWENLYDHGVAEVVDGEIHLTGNKKFFLTTKKKYADFELQVEIMLPAVGPANSGIMFRAHTDKTKPKHKVWGYQAECDPTPRAYSGRVYDEGRSKWALLTDEQKESYKNVQAPLGKWISYRIRCKGDHIQVWVNDQVTSDFRNSADAVGVIGVQHHGEKGKTYKFRNIKIMELQ